MSRITTRRMPRLETLEARKLLSADVTGEQQLMMELINEALVAPEAAAERVEQGLTRSAIGAITRDGDSVEGVIAEIADAEPRPPVAWDPALAAAARSHTNYQIRLGRQTHDGPSGLRSATDRAIAAGYDDPEAIAENIIYGVDSSEHAMRAFLADYGPTNADDPHRENIQQPDQAKESLQDVGVAIIPVEVPVQISTPFGTPSQPVVETKLVVTQLFGRKEEAAPKLLGVVYEDKDADRFYDVGEGVSGATVTITDKATGDSTDVQTWTSGGYQAEVGPGDYKIEVRLGDRLLGRREAQVGGENTKVDFRVNDAPKSSPQVATPPATTRPTTGSNASSTPSQTPSTTTQARPSDPPATRTQARPTPTPTTSSASTSQGSTPNATPAPKPSEAPPAATPPRQAPPIDASPVSTSPATAAPTPSTGQDETRAQRPTSTGSGESSRAIERLRNIAARSVAPEGSSAMSLLRTSFSGTVRSWKIAD